MPIFKKLLLIPLIAIVLGAFLLILMTAPRSHALTLSSANYSNYLVDDFIFTNSNTMGAAAIQNFLQNEGSGLATSKGYVDCSSNFAFMSTYYPCSTITSAANIIYDAGQAYGLNPQSIMATLQKEQSLITTPNPAASQLNFAMGYGCPDSTGCSNSHTGFFNQVDWGTWQLRLNIELMSGRSYFGISPSNYACNGHTRYYSQALKPGSVIHFYDDNGTDYNDTVLADASTASLYCYTPHVYNNPNGLFGLPRYGSSGLYYSGSYNFAYYFTLWWGSTFANDTYTPHPNGTLVSYHGLVYMIDNKTKRWITNADIFNSYRYPWFLVKDATTGDVNLPNGSSIDTLAPGSVFYTDNSPVYAMTYDINGTPQKQQISQTAFYNLGYSWSDVQYVPVAHAPASTAAGILFISQHPPGTLVVDNSNGKVYLLDYDQSAKQFTKRWILGPDAFTTNNFAWSEVKTATAQDLSLTDGTPINLRQGNMLLSGGNIYLVDYDSSGIMKRPVGPWACFANRWHYASRDLYQLSMPGSLPSRTGDLATC